MSDTNFLSAGIQELQRRYARFMLRRTLKQHAADRVAALTALGQRAWNEKIDLSAFADVREGLTAIDARVGEIAQTRSRLGNSKAAVEQKRREQLASFTGQRDAVLEKKHPIDASLAQLRSRVAECERTIAKGDARPAAEQAEIGPAVRAARESLPGLIAEERRLSGESQAFAVQIAGIDAARKDALGPLDSEIRRLSSELEGAATQADRAQQERGANLGRLGASLYDAHVEAPVLTEHVARVAAIDRNRTATEASLAGSDAVTRTLPAGTMGKFWGTLGVVAVVTFALISLADRPPSAVRDEPTASTPASGSNAATPAPSSAASGAEDGNVEAKRTELVNRVVRAGKGASDSDRKEAVRILKLDLEALGATADAAYLPVVRPILRSDEPALRKAAIDAIGMIGPTDADRAELTRLLNDPSSIVSSAAQRTLRAH